MATIHTIRLGIGSLGEVNNTALIQQSGNSISQLITASASGSPARIAAVGAQATIGTLVALGTIGGPVGAVISGIIGIGMAVANLFKGCGQTCIQATHYADDAQKLLVANLNHYRSAPIHYASLQAAAANNARTVMNALYQGCSNPQLGPAGQRCISERLVKGGTAPWCPTGTGCDWITVYLDPILNDPDVVPDPAPASATASGSNGAAGSLPNTGSPGATGTVGNADGASTFPAPLMIAAALIVAAIALDRH